MDSPESRTIKNWRWNGQPRKQNDVGFGCGSWAAATINLTLHCVKLMLPGRHRPSRYTARNEGAAISRRGPCTVGLWVQCTCSPTNRTFSVSVAKTLLQRRTADWPPQVAAGTRVLHLHVWKWEEKRGSTGEVLQLLHPTQNKNAI